MGTHRTSTGIFCLVLCLIVVICLAPDCLFARSADNDPTGSRLTEKQSSPSQGLVFHQRARHFGTVYLAQWIVYGVTQGKVIRKYGSFENLIELPFQPRFDKDHLNYNLVKHAISGNYYYLFYRSRGYDVKQAFVGAFASSLAFEFAVETLTEPPSIQDIYQTPVFGTLVGIGVERLSLVFLASESSLVRSIGYVLNPFSLFPGADCDASVLPMFDSRSMGLIIKAEL